VTAETRIRGLAAHVDLRGGHRRTALRQRLQTLIATLGEPARDGEPTHALISRLAAELHEPTDDRVWLTLAVISGRLPHPLDVADAIRTARLDGSVAALAKPLKAHRPGWPVRRGPWPRVRVVTGQVLVDVHHTSRTGLATGIQRVARQSAQRWERDHSPVLVGWTHDLRSLRALTAAERSQALYGHRDAEVAGSISADLLVPWHCTYVLPELMTEARRALALEAMLQRSGTTGSMIGFDCVPLTSAETIAEGMGAGFSQMLSAMAYGARIAAISQAAATEYRGWRAMLAGAGLAGPEITAIPLPVEAVEPSPAAMAEAHELLVTDGLPMVLCVGSHEPRKNHLAVLHAAEVLWREGLQFSLAFVGGNAWHSERFAARLAELQSAGRPLTSVRGLSDDLLWAAYRLARCVIFPSLNEGFGLPVAEALASGTPAITSGFGSMREIAAEGGAELVDPRDDRDIRDALRRLLTDDDLHARRSAEARSRSVRTWEHYACEAWAYLIDGRAPDPTSAGSVAASALTGAGDP